MATLVDFRNRLVDNDQNHPFDISQSFVQCHDLLIYNAHVSSHITFQQPVRSYPIVKDYLQVHLLHSNNKKNIFFRDNLLFHLDFTYPAPNQESYQGLVYNLVLVHLNQLN